MEMKVQRIDADKKRFLPLLLLADEQESMIDRYLDRGELFALHDDGVAAICVVTQEGERVYEIKNMAVEPARQRKGYGKKLIGFVRAHYADVCDTLLVGTGDSPLTLSFYKACGFVPSHRVKNFFVDNYDHAIVEDGVLLVDMVYLKMDLRCANAGEDAEGGKS